MIISDYNLSAKVEIEKILERVKNIHYNLKVLYDYLVHTQESYALHCRGVYKGLTHFQEKISKASFYSTEKTKQILNLSQKYREFPSRIETLAMLNIQFLHKMNKFDVLKGKQAKLKTSFSNFNAQFKDYTVSIKQYEAVNQIYDKNCQSLMEIIQKFKSYNDPLKFYNKTITNEYQQSLEKRFNESKNQQTKLKTELQLLDSKRVALDELLRAIRQAFTAVFHSCLKILEKLIRFLTDPSREDSHELKLSRAFKQRNSLHSETYEAQFDRLNTFTSQIDEGKQLMNDFGDIIKHGNKSKRYNELVSDHKFFHDRCQNLKSHKEKAFKETLALQTAFYELIVRQNKVFREYEREFAEKERRIYSSGGKDGFKKDFKSFFGEGTYKMLELCLAVIDAPKTKFGPIHELFLDNTEIIGKILEDKREGLSRFNKIFTEIMSEHLRIKEQYEQSHQRDEQIGEEYRNNITQSLDKFKFIFSELENLQSNSDLMVAEKLKHTYKFIEKSSSRCKIAHILQTNQERVEKLKSFNSNTQTMIILKNDSLYTVLFEEGFSSNLQKRFQSKINEGEFETVQSILKQKEEISKKMLKQQIGCCGLVKARPINNEIISEFRCTLVDKQIKEYHGIIKVLKEGLTFQEKQFNPFKSKIYILIPNSDIKFIGSKTYNQSSDQPQVREAVTVQTLKGPIIFLSQNNYNEMIETLQKNYGEAAFRKSVALEKSAIKDKNSSTDSSMGKIGKSVFVSYNKNSGNYDSEPVFSNPALNLMNKTSSNDPSSLTGPGGSDIKGLAPRIQLNPINPKQKQQNLKSLKELMKHFDKRQFLSKKIYKFIDTKQYKSKERRDYQLVDEHYVNNFVVKELKKYEFVESVSGTVLEIHYEWKVAFPDNVALKSFRHGQKMTIDLNVDPPVITVIQWPHIKKEIFSRNFFYDSIQEMNQNIVHYMAKNTGKEYIYETNIEREYDSIDNTSQIVAEDFKGDTYTEEFCPHRLSGGTPNSTLIHHNNVLQGLGLSGSGSHEKTVIRGVVDKKFSLKSQKSQKSNLGIENVNETSKGLYTSAALGNQI